MASSRLLWILLGLGGSVGAGSVAGCIGSIGETPEIEAPPADPLVSGLRRLTVVEYDNTVRDLLHDPSRPGALLLPDDARVPFDNVYAEQTPSRALIDSAELLAGEAAERLLAEPARRDEVLGCVPASTTDETCFMQFVERFGRLTLRRTLTEEERGSYAALLTIADEQGDFYAAVEAALRALLQEPHFLYRVEVGEEVEPGVYRLTGSELAARMSYTLWGSMPDAWLLDAAEGGGLETDEQIAAVAQRMLDDPRAREQVARFHAMWLGYETLPFSSELASAMQTETNALLERVIFDERRPWYDLLRSEETFAGDMLAAHYGLTPPGSEAPVWIPYGENERRGLLSHGSFLSVGVRAADTSPTLRGLAIRTRLFCQEIPPPPPDVAPDDGPTGEAECKADLYAEHARGGCAGCHMQMDPVGMGIENYDREGRYRSHDEGKPQCTIDGIGELAGIGSFHGPAELAELAISSGELEDCVAEQLYRFISGRAELDVTDRRFIRELGATGEFRFDELLVRALSHPSFRHRRDQRTEP